MSDENVNENNPPRYEPNLNEDVGHTFSLGIDGEDDEGQTEPAYFLNPPEYDLKKLEEEVAKRNYSLGLHSGVDQEETEPDILVNPPEYDVDEVKEQAGQKD